jgi:putative ABC transport system permease protein
MVLQLSLVGLVLELVFTGGSALLVFAVGTVMLAAAAYEVGARQTHRFQGLWGLGIGLAAMFLSSYVLTLFTLTAVLQPDPWYAPRYLIPLLGMLLGNTMNGVALALERLTSLAARQANLVEARLLLGFPWRQACEPIRREAARAGMIPAINATAAAGLVSLPGMMTGQILAGTPPAEAVKYQILIMLLILAGVGFGMLAALELASRRLFDQRERLRLDRLTRS